MKSSGTLMLMTILLLLFGCSSGIKSISVLETASPHNGSVKVRLAGEYVPRTPTLIQIVVKTAFGTLDSPTCQHYAGQLPQGELMEEVKQKGASLGANVLVFSCGRVGTEGACFCTADGYFEP